MAEEEKPTLTREKIREFCDSNPPPAFSEEHQRAREMLAKFFEELHSFSEDFKNIHEENHRQSPPKIDEVVYRVRENLEEAIAHLTACSESEKVAALAQETSSLLEDIRRKQEALSKAVADLVDDLLPKDFRISILRAEQKRREEASQAELQRLVENGGTITEKFDLMWDQQMKRREALVSIGNSTGIYRFLIVYVAGIPDPLLEFCKQVNDANGPMEEWRQTYGPRYYEVFYSINDLRKLAASIRHLTEKQKELEESDPTPPSDAPSTSHHHQAALDCFSKSMKEFGNEMLATLQMSEDYFAISPMLKFAKSIKTAP